MMNKRNYKTMDRVLQQTYNHYSKHYALKEKMETLRTKMEEAGTWQQFCDERGLAPDFTFEDCGA